MSANSNSPGFSLLVADTSASTVGQDQGIQACLASHYQARHPGTTAAHDTIVTLPSICSVWLPDASFALQSCDETPRQIKRKIMFRSIVLLVVCLMPAVAAAENRDVVLIVDKSVATLTGRLYQTSWENAEIGVNAENKSQVSGAAVSSGSNANIYIPPPNIQNVSPMMQMGGDMGAAVVLGLIEAAMEEKRQVEMKPIREPINKELLRLQVFRTTEKIIDQHGFRLKGKSIAKGASKIVMPSASGPDGPKYGIVIERLTGPIVSISMDHRKPVLMARISLNKWIGGKRVNTIYSYDICYIGEAAPAGANAVEYWSADNASAFLKQVDAGFSRMLEYALAEGEKFEANPESEKLLKEEIKTFGKPDGNAPAIELVDGNYAYYKVYPGNVVMLPAAPKTAP